MAAFDLQLPTLELVPPVVLPARSPRSGRVVASAWYAGAGPLRARHDRGAVCHPIFPWPHYRQKLDALEHLANICMMKAGGGYWSPRPYLRFKVFAGEPGLGKL